MYAESPDHVLGVCKRTEEDDHAYTDSLPTFPYRNRNKTWTTPFIYLPHSCDYWVIGGAREARLLIAHLEAAIAELEEPK